MWGKKSLLGFLLIMLLVFICESATAVIKPEFHYGSFTGIVQELEPWVHEEGAKFVFLKNEEGAPAHVIISQATYLWGNEEIKVGERITVYYDARKPMIMIYPPQYSAEVVVVENERENVKFDYFNENLISSDYFLQLKVNEDTEIVLKEGTPFTGDLAEKDLLVIYGAATKSIPAQTVPRKIIVFPCKEPQIVVNNQVLNIPWVENSLMPLRVIAEALGYQVDWEQAAQKIKLGDTITLTIGETVFTKDDHLISLEMAPRLEAGKTLVPLSFFREIAEINISDEQIIINGS